MPEIIGPFKKATRSNTLQNVGCVEAAPTANGGLAFRDSKLGEASPVLFFASHEIGAFLDGLNNGEFGDFTLPA